MIRSLGHAEFCLTDIGATRFRWNAQAKRLSKYAEPGMLLVPETPHTTLVKDLMNRDGGAIGKAITLIESDPQAAERLFRSLRPATSATTHTIGVTGTPGAGKSSLIAQLLRRFRHSDQSVAVLAIDPSSPQHGGAVLGDRIRMSGFEVDPKVYIRSMSARGLLGGLAPTAIYVIDLLETLGFDFVIIETVGVGQSETLIRTVVDSVIVVLDPNFGDEVQLDKAGLLEIADIFVVTHPESSSAEIFRRRLEAAIGTEEGHRAGPSVHLCSPLSGHGIDELMRTIDVYGKNLSDREVGRRRGKVLALLQTVLTTLSEEVYQQIGSDEHLVMQLANRSASVWETARHHLAKLGVRVTSETRE